MDLRAVLLVFFAAVFLGAHGAEFKFPDIASFACIAPHTTCAKKAVDWVGISSINQAFTLLLDKERLCKVRHEYKSCVANSQDCLNKIPISFTLKLLENANEKLKCGCSTTVAPRVLVLMSLVIVLQHLAQKRFI